MFRIMTFGITILSTHKNDSYHNDMVMILSITTFSITILSLIIENNDLQHIKTQHSAK